MEKCFACPRKCGAVREYDKPSSGVCKMPYNAVIARAALHLWEEPCISGTNGSGAIFFSGCSLKCIFCQNYDISHNGTGKAVSEERFIEIMQDLEAQGAHNINLVNPTHFVPFIRKALLMYKPKIPVVYNTGGYDTVDSIRSLEGLVDVYLPDFKYIDRTSAAKYSQAPDYFDAASLAIQEMVRQTGPNVFENGLLKRGVLVRHLVLPGSSRESVRILEWIRENLPVDTYVSLMRQYTPAVPDLPYRALNRRLVTAEYDRVVKAFWDLGLKNGFMQESTSAETGFIPPFDLTGV